MLHFNTNIPSLPPSYGMNTVFVSPNFMLPMTIVLVLPGRVVEDSGGCDSAGAHYDGVGRDDSGDRRPWYNGPRAW